MLNQLSEIDKGWLAGFFEGEGHLGICTNVAGYYRYYTRKGILSTYLRKKDHHFLQISVTSSIQHLVEPFSVFGGNIIKSGPNAYRWYTSGNEAIEFLKFIASYIRGDHLKQIPLAIEFQKIKSRANKRLSELERTRLEELTIQINSFNLKKGRKRHSSQNDCIGRLSDE